MKSLVPLKRYVDPTRPITYGIVQAGPDVPDGVPYIRPVDMDSHSGIPDVSQLRTTSREIASQYRRSAVRSGDLIVSIGPSYGKTMIVPTTLDGANLTQGTARVAPAAGVEVRFLRWAVQGTSAVDFWNTAVGGATFRALNLEPLALTPIPWRSPADQRAIADYLDAETARIDALIEKKRRMVEVLSERLRFVVRDLTTGRGELVPLRRVVRQIKTGTTPPADESARLQHGPVPWYSPGDVEDWTQLGPAARTLSFEAILQGWVPRFPANSTLVVGIGATAGRVAHLESEGSGNQQMTCVTPGPTVIPRFLSWQLFARADELQATAPFTTLPILNNDFLASVPFYLPGIQEQLEVVDHLEEQTSRTRQLCLLLDRQIAALDEYRQAAITAAVTGAIVAGAAA